jgi:hypothetical protein
MAFASSDRVQLAYIPEATFGVIPVTGNGKNLRMQGESLNFNLTKDNDKEITADAQMTSTTTVNASAAGDIKVHMQYGEYDPLLASAMRSAWAAMGTNGVTTSFTADFTATTITAAVAPTGSSAFTTLQKGQWFKIYAPANANNGKFFRVSTSVAPSSTVITLDANTVATAGTAVANVTLASSRLANATTLTSFTVEMQSADIAQYLTYTGMTVSKFAVTFASAALTDASFSFLGKSHLRNTVTALPGTTAASLNYDIQNAVTGVNNLWENGVPLTSTSVKSISVDIDSALRAQDAIGTLGAVSLGIGTLMVKGSVTIYFADGALYDKFLNDTYTSLSLLTKDVAGNGYVISLPKVMLSNGKVDAGSKNSDLMATFDYTAYADRTNATAALQKTIFIDRVGAAVLP